MILSHISKQVISKGEAIKGQDIREGVFKLIQTEFPDFSADSKISLQELNQYRRLYLTKLVEQEKGELALIDLDVMRAIRDYKINLKAELEIKLLSEKVDHLLVQQNKKLLEIQEVQIDYLEDVLKEIKKK